MARRSVCRPGGLQSPEIRLDALRAETAGDSEFPDLKILQAGTNHAITFAESWRKILRSPFHPNIDRSQSEEAAGFNLQSIVSDRTIVASPINRDKFCPVFLDSVIAPIRSVSANMPSSSHHSR